MFKAWEPACTYGDEYKHTWQATQPHHPHESAPTQGCSAVRLTSLDQFLSGIGCCCTKPLGASRKCGAALVIRAGTHENKRVREGLQ